MHWCLLSRLFEITEITIRFCVVTVILASLQILCVVIISCVLLQLFEFISRSMDDRREVVTALAVPCFPVLCCAVLHCLINEASRSRPVAVKLFTAQSVSYSEARGSDIDLTASYSDCTVRINHISHSLKC